MTPTPRRRTPLVAVLALAVALAMLPVAAGAATGPVSGTQAPELQSVDVIGNGSTSDVAVVRFSFDQPVDGKDPIPDSAGGDSVFRLYSVTAEPFPPINARIESGSSDAILAEFTWDAVSESTVGAVGFDAVRSPNGLGNPEGAVGLDVGGDAVDVALDAGVTLAPDLQAAGDFDVANRSVDFAFDHDAVAQGGAYRLVMDDGRVLSSTSVSNGDGSPVHTVVFDELTETGPNGFANVRRAVVDPGTVRGAATDDRPRPAPGAPFDNPLQSVELEGGQTQDPELTGEVELDRDNGLARFTFDEPVDLTGGPGDFVLYDRSGSEIAASTVTRLSNDASTVVAEYGVGTIDARTVGASVRDGAVASQTGTTRTNTAQEQPTSAPAGFAAGETEAPELVSTRIEGVGDDLRVVYSFDQPVTGCGEIDGQACVDGDFSADRFVIYRGNGQRFVGSDAATNGQTTSEIVVRFDGVGPPDPGDGDEGDEDHDDGGLLEDLLRPVNDLVGSILDPILGGDDDADSDAPRMDPASDDADVHGPTTNGGPANGDDRPATSDDIANATLAGVVRGAAQGVNGASTGTLNFADSVLLQ